MDTHSWLADLPGQRHGPLGRYVTTGAKVRKAIRKIEPKREPLRPSLYKRRAMSPGFDAEPASKLRKYRIHTTGGSSLDIEARSPLHARGRYTKYFPAENIAAITEVGDIHSDPAAGLRDAIHRSAGHWVEPQTHSFAELAGLEGETLDIQHAFGVSYGVKCSRVIGDKEDRCLVTCVDTEGNVMTLNGNAIRRVRLTAAVPVAA